MGVAELITLSIQCAICWGCEGVCQHKQYGRAVQAGGYRLALGISDTSAIVTKGA